MNIMRATRGRAEVLGAQSARLSAREFEQIGYVSENQEMPGWMTLKYFLDYLKPFYTRWDDERSQELLRQFDLPLNTRLANLSRGMRVKAALVSSLAYHPLLLVLDEPFSGLDALVRDELIGALLECAERATVLISSHDLSEIESFASHVGYLEKGRLRFSEEMGTLTGRFQSIEIALDQPPSFPKGPPSTWLEMETAADLCDSSSPPITRKGRTPGEEHFGDVDITVNPMSLREIFVALAKTAERRRERRQTMKQTMHIFIRMFAICGPRFWWFSPSRRRLHTQARSAERSARCPTYPTFASLALGFGWWYLIAVVIHQEVLPGHQQYWLTRPYSWKSLLAAKALFIVSFINLPKLLADFVILEGQGFQAASYWTSFIASQLLFTAVWLLPYAALAAVTRNLRQFFLAVLIGWILLTLPSFFLDSSSYLLFRGIWFGAAWMQHFVIIAIVLTASLVILLWQYSQRRTAMSRLIAICALILVLGIPQLISMRALMAVQMRLSGSRMDVSPIQIVLDPARKEPKTRVTGRRPGYEGTIAIDIPLQITELPAGTSIISDSVKVEIVEPDGRVSEARGTIQQESDGAWERLFIRPDVFQRLKEERLTMRHSAYLSLLGDTRTTQIEPGERGTVVPDLGICRFVTQDDGQGHDYSITCFTPFRRSPVFAATQVSQLGYSPLDRAGGRDDRDLQPGSYSPYPAEGGISPLVTSARENGSISGGATPMARVVTKSVLAHIRHDFETSGVRLRDYASGE